MAKDDILVRSEHLANSFPLVTFNSYKPFHLFLIIYIISIDGHQVVDIIPLGLELPVSEGESIKLDHLLMRNPNMGVVSQGDAEIVL